MKIFLLINLVLAMTGNVYSQFEDSIRLALKQKPRVTIRLDNRYTVTSTKSTELLGIKTGLEYMSVLRMGVGFNLLKSNIYRTIMITNHPTDAHLQLKYGCFFLEYVFYRDKRWEFTVPVQAGIGYAYYEYRDNSVNYRIYPGVIINYETALSGQYRFFTYLGASATMGILLQLKRNSYMNENFNTPVFSLGMKVFAGEFYHDLIRRKKHD